MKDEQTPKRSGGLTKTIPAVRVTDEVYEFYQQRADEERRRLSDAVRIALEDHANQLREEAAAAA